MSALVSSDLRGDAEVQLLLALLKAKGSDEVNEAAISALLSATSADRAAILRFEDDGVIRFKAWRDLSAEYRQAVTGHTPWLRGMRNAQPIAVADVLIDETLAQYAETFARERIRALAFIPLELDDGVFGKFMLYYAQPHEFEEQELTIAQAIASHVALAAEHKRLEAASRYLAAIVENSDDAILSKDLDGIITSWNEGARRVFGYTAAEALGKPVSMLAPPERMHEMRRILDRIHEGKRVEPHDTVRRRKDGQAIHVSVTVSPVRNASGEIAGASEIARDISGRKQAEEERARLLAGEREARKVAELLNGVGPMLTAELDLEKLVQAVTDVATEMVGAEFGSFFHNVVNEKGESYTLYTLSGVSRETFAGFPMPRNTEVFAPTFRGEGVVRSDDITQDPRYGKNAPHHGMPKGHLPVRSYLAASVVSRGEVLGGLFFGHSTPGKFTEKHEALTRGVAAQAAIAMENARLFEQAQWVQNELKRSNEELRRANQDLETFAYSASHDLNEPLRTIAISAQLLERTCVDRLEGEEAKFLAVILQGVRRMESLIQDLLAYTTATEYEDGSPPGVDSGQVVAAVLENLKGLLGQAGAAVTHGALPLVAMHESRLAQVFQNLIGNALKYRGPEAPRVHISAIRRDGWCVLSVADNGIGIDPKFADSIFGLFKRLHTRDEYPGSGIGLAICQRIVERYGGRIWLEKSVLAEGSTFSFSVPTEVAHNAVH
jgi:PAS domain S-box-containing protein